MNERAASGRESAEDLYVIEEHSLWKFLENEPEIYTESDVKVCYPMLVAK